jgi:hypothetical protein
MKRSRLLTEQNRSDCNDASAPPSQKRRRRVLPCATTIKAAPNERNPAHGSTRISADEAMSIATRQNRKWAQVEWIRSEFALVRSNPRDPWAKFSMFRCDKSFIVGNQNERTD